jgi:biopolymer transport protein ExbD
MKSNILTSTARVRPDIEPVLPLINVVFLLLIFFMLTGKMIKPSEQGISAPIVQHKNRAVENNVNNWLYLTMKGDFIYQGKLVVNIETASFVKQQSITLFVDGKTTGDILNQAFNKLAKIHITQISVVTEKSGGS